MKHYMTFHSYGNGTNGIDDRGDFACDIKIVDGSTKDQALAQELINVQSIVWENQPWADGGIRSVIHRLP